MPNLFSVSEVFFFDSILLGSLRARLNLAAQELEQNFIFAGLLVQ